MNLEPASKTSAQSDTRAPVLVNPKTLEILLPSNSPFFRGYQASPDYKVVMIHEPKFHWTREKIPFDLWAQIVSFMKWSQATNKAEAHCALFYHTEENIWDACVFPQLCVGMTVRLLEDDPDYATDRARFGKGWIMAGSVHHHCEAGAFQSSTDSADERNKDGVHITVGKVSEKQVDLHTRQVWNEDMNQCEITDWIKMPHWTEAVPVGILTGELRRQIMATIVPVEFPEMWKTKTRTAVVHPQQRGQHVSNLAWFDGKIEAFLNDLAAQFQTSLTRMSDILQLSNGQASMLSIEDQSLRLAVKEAIFKTKWPSLYCEAVLETMLTKQRTHPHDEQTAFGLG